MSMADAVDRRDPSPQFLFAAYPDARLIIGFRINRDGSLAPVSGSPFVTRTPLGLLLSVGNALIAAGQDTIFAFSVDQETGSIRETDAIKTAAIARLLPDLSTNAVIATTSAGKMAFRLSKGKLQALPEEMATTETASAKGQSSPSAVLDASGRFMYVVDAGKAELQGFQVGQGKPAALSPPSYPVSRGTRAIAVVKH
jgi:6-phosphogluconolactonase (cycloisomerase 2 family)